MERVIYRLVGVFVIALVVVTILVQARPAFADTYLIQSYAYADSSASGWMTITDSNGIPVFSSSVSQWYDSEYQYSPTRGQAANFDRPFRQFGDPPTVTTANWTGLAKTDYGTNAVKVKLDGIMSSQMYNDTFATSQGNTGTIDISASRYVTAQSQWQELFLITPKDLSLVGGVVSFTMNMQFDVKKFSDPYGNPPSGSWYAQQSNFDYSHSLYYDSSQNNSNSFAVNLSETYDGVKLGEPYLLRTIVGASLSDLGEVDISETLRVTSIEIPPGSKITFLSGAGSTAYGDILGGNGYGQYGPGGGGGVVPIPSTIYLLAPGIAALIGLRKRLRN